MHVCMSKCSALIILEEALLQPARIMRQIYQLVSAVLYKIGTFLPLTEALTPAPGSVEAFELEGTSRPLCLAAWAIDSARGCLVALSADAVRRNMSSADTLPVLAMSTSCRDPCRISIAVTSIVISHVGLQSVLRLEDFWFHAYSLPSCRKRKLTLVRVPVLSKTSVSSSANLSRTSPPRRSNPRLAPRDDATSTAVGVANPKAHGQATTRTLTASLSPSKVLVATPAASRAPGKRLAPANILSSVLLVIGNLAHQTTPLRGTEIMP